MEIVTKHNKMELSHLLKKNCNQNCFLSATEVAMFSNNSSYKKDFKIRISHSIINTFTGTFSINILF